MSRIRSVTSFATFPSFHKPFLLPCFPLLVVYPLEKGETKLNTTNFASHYLCCFFHKNRLVTAKKTGKKQVNVLNHRTHLQPQSAHKQLF